ncbi:MAG: NUDIX hydrolase [Steroidobacteraceae bacterium]
MREHLRALLDAHTAHDDEEAASLAQMRSLVRTLEDPFSRHQPQAHFTGSALVLDEANQRIALIHHAKLGRWLQPGGHAEPADQGLMHATALREAREETGCDVALFRDSTQPIDVDVHLIPSRGDEEAHWHLDLRFVVVAQNPEAMSFDPSESLGARWVTFEEALSIIEEGPLRRLIRKGQRDYLTDLQNTDDDRRAGHDQRA